uniref:Tumor necrosis factor ligand superfamily member 6 n=2 Tax=Callorhinchus milii TaxID=7868 RepID=V9LKT8_CALMI
MLKLTRGFGINDLIDSVNLQAEISSRMTDCSAMPDHCVLITPICSIGHKQPIKPSENIREAAHLTGKSSAANTLLWDDTKDIAFTRGVRYKDGGLIINETGLFFIYSKIYFRNLICVKDLELEQTLFVRTSRYPKDMILMETKKNKYCVVKDTVWYINSYQAGIFKLHNGDHIYVNVSNTNLVSFDQTKTFFGLYKL